MRTLGEFLADLDEQKREAAGDDVPEPESFAELYRVGEGVYPLAVRQAERTGCTLEDMSEAAIARTAASTAASIQLIIAGGQPMAKAIQTFQASCWVDGFLAGVLWEQARTLEGAMGGGE